MTVEHLGCREWLDEVAASGAIRYRDTGRMEWSVAITPSKPMAGLLVDAIQGSRDRAGVVNPVKGGFLGAGSSLSRAGIPTIGYISQPNYLLAQGPADGCIEKLSPDLMYSQIGKCFAKLVHRIDGLTAAELEGRDGRRGSRLSFRWAQWRSPRAGSPRRDRPKTSSWAAWNRRANCWRELT